MLVIVASISWLVQVYSIGYMSVILGSAGFTPTCRCSPWPC